VKKIGIVITFVVFFQDNMDSENNAVVEFKKIKMIKGGVE
jgi:hypothetical protein